VRTLADGDKGVRFQYWDDAAGAPAFDDGPSGLEKLDYVVAKARAEGLRLVLPLTNNWGAFGGMDQYLLWAQAAGEDVDTHDDFYTNPQVKAWYKQWVSHLLNRTNSITGVAYKDDPTIMTWELANEPRCIGDGGPADGSWGSGLFPRDAACTASTITPWVTEMSAYIKSIDRHHLVATGDEGFFDDPSRGDWQYNGTDGVDSVGWAQVPTIDYLSFHLYPDHWGTDADWGSQWIADHNRAAASIHKPALLGEFGWQDGATRNTVFQQWLSTSLSTGGAGSLYWLLSDVRDDGTLYPDYDGFTVYCPSPVCTTVANYGQQLRSPSWGTYVPVADDDAATVPFGGTATVDVTANDIAYKSVIRHDTVDLDPTTAGRQTSVSVAGGTASVDPAGVVTVVPDAGFSGKIRVPYTVADRRGGVSGVATVTVEVEPDPDAAITVLDFESPLPSWESYGGGSLAEVDGHLQVTSNGESFVITLPQALDLTGRTKMSVDFLGTTTGVNAELILQVGPSWTWCQVAPISGTWTEPKTEEFDLTPCGDLSEVHAVGMWTHAGVHLYDDVVAR
jgi:mannan endo-1,4-beta-mannosidase